MFFWIKKIALFLASQTTRVCRQLSSDGLLHRRPVRDQPNNTTTGSIYNLNFRAKILNHASCIEPQISLCIAYTIMLFIFLCIWAENQTKVNYVSLKTQAQTMFLSHKIPSQNEEMAAIINFVKFCPKFPNQKLKLIHYSNYLAMLQQITLRICLTQNWSPTCLRKKIFRYC